MPGPHRQGRDHLGAQTYRQAALESAGQLGCQHGGLKIKLNLRSVLVGYLITFANLFECGRTFETKTIPNIKESGPGTYLEL